MIDTHTHLHPPRLFAAIRRWFAERSDWDISWQPTEPADVASVMRAAGVDRFVFCSYAHKPGMAREINAWLAQTSRDLDGYGLPLATVYPSDESPLDDLKAALDDGCIGLKLHEDVQGIAVDDDRMQPIFAEMARRGAYLMAHIGPIPWSYPPSIGIARVERLLAAHPTLNVVIAHMGAPDTNAYFGLMSAHSRLYLDTTMVFAENSPLARGDEIDITALASRADRILYGTDFPNIPYPYTRERTGLANLGLPEDALEAIMHGNAKQLLVSAGVA